MHISRKVLGFFIIRASPKIPCSTSGGSLPPHSREFSPNHERFCFVVDHTVGERQRPVGGMRIYVSAIYPVLELGRRGV
jgi:hypothetical protein